MTPWKARYRVSRLMCAIRTVLRELCPLLAQYFGLVATRVAVARRAPAPLLSINIPLKN